MKLLSKSRLFLLIGLVTLTQSVHSQFLMDMIDTTKDLGKGMLNLYSRYDGLKFGGYIQPQFQMAEDKGAKSYEGGDFSTFASSRFMLRRSRIRIDYVRTDKSHLPAMQFVFQFDATERGVNVRDVWARLFDNKYKRFAFTTGVFARPFGYEVNLSSSDRESPERGRMSQILMKTERDLGAMITFESRRKEDAFKYLKIDLGIFNGQGLTAPGEFDAYKDVIGRIALKPYKLSKNLSFSAGASYLNGGIYHNTKYLYEVATVNGTASFAVDSSAGNIGKKDPRVYKGVDAQLKYKNTNGGFTELRGEYWWGTQTATSSSSETPAALLASSDAYYIRPFKGAFVYFLQHLGSTKHQLGLKYDFYDPNSKVQASEIGKPGLNNGAANIRYNTYAVGYNYYMNENIKFMFWYHTVKNESTQLTGYTSDLKDNVLTVRMQYRF